MATPVKDAIKAQQAVVLNDNTSQDIDPKDSRDAHNFGWDAFTNVVREDLANTPILNTHISDNAVTTSKHADLSVTENKLATSAVSSAKIKAANVQTAAIKDLNVTLGKLSQPVQDLLLAVGGGTITNNPDDEDLESVSSQLKLKDRTSSGNQKGYKIIRQNFDFTNIPVGYDNSIWEIRYEHDILGANFTIPSGVTLRENGGIITNYGNITGNKTKVDCGLNQLFDASGDLIGTWNVEKAYPQWMGAMPDSGNDDTIPIQKTLPFLNIYFTKGTWRITDRLDIKSKTHIWTSEKATLTGIVAINTPYFKLETPNLKGVIIEGFKIDSATRPDSTSAGGVVRAHSADVLKQIVVKDLEIVTAGDYNSAISFVNPSGKLEDVLIENNHITCNGNFVYGIQSTKPTENLRVVGNFIILNASNTNNAIAVYGDAVRFNVLNNNCEKAGHSAIAVSPGSYGNIIGNNVKNVTNANEAGIEVQWKDSHNGVDVSHDVNVIGNTIDNCHYGILVNKDDQTNPDRITNVNIIGNIATNSSNTAAYIRYVDNINISDNIFDLAPTGVDFDDCDFINIQGNNIISTLGVIVGGTNVDNVAVQGNNIRNTGNGSMINITGNSSMKFSICNNMQQADAITTGSGIRVTNGSFGVINSNVIKGFVNYSVRLEAGVNDTRIIGNSFENSNQYQNLGDRNLFRNNVGLIDNSVSGTTSERPTAPDDYIIIGHMFFDRTLSKPIWWDGSNWKDATGANV